MIVAMKHLDLVCLASVGDETLAALRELGAVHLDLAAGQGASVAAAQGEAADAERAVRLVLKARERLEESVDPRPHTVAEILAWDAERAKLDGAAEALRREIRRYEPYGDFDPALAAKLLAAVPDLRETVELPETLPAKRLSAMVAELEDLRQRSALANARIAGSDEQAILKKYPALADRIAFEQAKALMAARGALAAVSGWVPVTHVASLTEAAHAAGWGLLLRDPAAGETPPTLINPPKFVRPVKALFEGLGIAPAYDEADVSVPFMCYFSLFFAMLVGDGAYGAILFAATLWGWLRYRGRRAAARSPVMRSWLVLMTVFSLATIAWGALSNTWFGAAIPGCAGWPTVRWLAGTDAAPGHQYDNMMFLCFTIGVTHLMLARVWNGICRLNSRACLQEFAWAGVVLFMYLLTNTIVGIFPTLPTWSFWMFGVSFLTLFTLAKGMDKGMLFLNTMSVLGDIISYVRLFAVGLASVQVAANFNGMAIDLGLPIWIKWLPLVLIMLVGHALNLAMAGLSVLVHAVRLNTLEFSNHKGISWAGVAFRAFARNAK